MAGTTYRWTICEATIHGDMKNLERGPLSTYPIREGVLQHVRT